ncbi:hypothetical protein ACQUY5_24255 [Bacillus cereus]|uniref:hypothetical protein n=1 Tax=Bacillus cereus TaxID=1396 RepID=UPI003D16F983
MGKRISYKMMQKELQEEGCWKGYVKPKPSNQFVGELPIFLQKIMVDGKEVLMLFLMDEMRLITDTTITYFPRGQIAYEFEDFKSRYIKQFDANNLELFEYNHKPTVKEQTKP